MCQGMCSAGNRPRFIPPCPAQHRDRGHDVLPLAEEWSSQGLELQPGVFPGADKHLQDTQTQPTARAWASGNVWDMARLAPA